MRAVEPTPYHDCLALRVDPRGIEAMKSYLDRLWDRALSAFKAAAEKETDS